MASVLGRGRGVRRVSVRFLVAAILVALFFVELSVARSLSFTCDEVLDAGAGVADLEHGRVELFPERPPLARRISGLAAYALGAREGPAAAGIYPEALGRYGAHYAYADLLVLEDNKSLRFPRARPGADALVTAARIPFLAFPILLGAVAFAWASVRFGPRGGLVALLLVATHPDVLGLGPLAVQDAALAALALFTAFAADRFRAERRWRWVLALGLGAGLTLAAKLTALPILLATGAVLAFGRALDRRLVVAAAIALASLSILYLGAEPVSTYVQTARALGSFVETKERLKSALSPEGVGHTYFLVVTALRMPLGTLAILALALVVSRRHHGSAAEELSLHAPAVALFLTVSAIANPFGSRYALPAVPFFLVSCGRVASWAGRSRWRWIALGLVLATNVAGAVLDHPFHASSLNRLAGRPERAYSRLEDLYQDWGGGLKALADWQRSHGDPPLVVVPFGSTATLISSPEGPFARFDQIPWLGALEPWGVRGEARDLQCLFSPERGRVYAVSTNAARNAVQFDRQMRLLRARGAPAFEHPLVLGDLERPSELVGGGLLIFDRR
jgi:hypothetical protein